MSTGGMGAVYEVIHRETKRRRALKVMLPTLLEDPTLRKRFALEAVVAADISSEHLIEIFDAGVDEETESPFIAMELLRGEDLGKRTERLGRLPPAEVIELFEQATRPFDQMHKAGIVHRDLKPENLFRTERDDGSPKLKILDFGIAKLIHGTDRGRSTQAGGTPLYMAPEQLESGEGIGPEADVYAMGLVTYTLLVGAPYFQGEADASQNLMQLLLAVSKGTIEPASARAAVRGVVLPKGFDAWFRRATARAPSERFAGIGEMVRELKLILPDTESIASTDPAPRGLLLAGAPRETAGDPAAEDGASDPARTIELGALPKPSVHAASVPSVAVSKVAGASQTLVSVGQPSAVAAVSASTPADLATSSRDELESGRLGYQASDTASPTTSGRREPAGISRRTRWMTVALVASIGAGVFAWRWAARDVLDDDAGRGASATAATATPSSAAVVPPPSVQVEVGSAIQPSSQPAPSVAHSSVGPIASSDRTAQVPPLLPSASLPKGPLPGAAPIPKLPPAAATATSTLAPWERRDPIKP